MKISVSRCLFIIFSLQLLITSTLSVQNKLSSSPDRNLVDRAQALLGKIFKKREDDATSKNPVEVERPSKRGRSEDGSPVIQKVSAFMAERPVNVDEDPNPFVVKWGLLNKNTVVGNSQVAVEWSKNVVSPRDMAEVVKSSEDLQIELMGSQAIASVNAYLQAALYNLREARAEKAVAERDKDRYISSSQANFERFRATERELVDAKEKVKQLEAQLQRGHEEAIAEYKASQEFEDLLSAEYDANFPGTFKECWEEIIAELGSKIKGVTLQKFPVPDLLGLPAAETAATLTSSQPVDDPRPLEESEPTDDFIEDLDAPRKDAPVLTSESGDKDPLDDLDIE